RGRGEQCPKTGRCHLGASPGKHPGRHLASVRQRPARNHTVKRQNKEAGSRPHPADTNKGLRRFKFMSQALHRMDRAATAFTAHHNLSHHHRNARHQNAEQIHQDKSTTTVFTGNVGKLPDIPQPHRRTGGCKNKGPASPPNTVYTRFASTHSVSDRAKAAIVVDLPALLNFKPPPEWLRIPAILVTTGPLPFQITLSYTRAHDYQEKTQGQWRHHCPEQKSPPRLLYRRKDR